MRRIAWQALAATGALCFIAGSAHAASAIKWQTSFTKAQAQAKKSHKLIMTDFYAEW